GLVISVTTAEFTVEFRQGLESVARCLGRRSRNRMSAASSAATSRWDHGQVTLRTDGRIAHAGTIGRFEFAVIDLLDARKALLHDLHVRGNDSFAEAAELLLVLLLDRRQEGFVADVVMLEEGRNAEEGAKEGVALHAELEIAAISCLTGNIEPGQNVNSDIIFL